MGTWKKEGNQFPSSKKLIQKPEGNEENTYSDLGSKKMKKTMPKNPLKPPRKTSKKKSCK
jgi:hypothetical protein